MHVRERSHSRLVIEDRSWRPSAVLVVTAALIWTIIVRRSEHVATASLGPLFLLLVAWLGHFRAVTAFDRTTGVVRHTRRRIGRVSDQVHAVADIIAVDLTLPPLSRHLRRWLIQVQLGSGAAFWLSPRPSPRVEVLRAIRTEICGWLGLPNGASAEEQVRALVRAGNTVEAIRLLRAEHGLSLAAARRRVDELTTGKA